MAKKTRFAASAKWATTTAAIVSYANAAVRALASHYPLTNARTNHRSLQWSKARMADPNYIPSGPTYG